MMLLLRYSLPLFLCIIGEVNAYKAAAFIGEVSQRDRSRPVYPIYFPKIGSLADSVPPRDQFLNGMKTVRIVTPNGQRMRCAVPKQEVFQPVSLSPGDKQSALEHQFDEIENLLKGYEEKCFLRFEGWWTYEFCYGKHVVQKHIIPREREPLEGEQEVEFILGMYNRKDDIVRRRKPDQVSTQEAPFTQLFTNGSICDTTGKPRQVLVKYICRDDHIQSGPSLSLQEAFSTNPHLNILNLVREVESCVYEVEFLNGLICKHPAYHYKLSKVELPIHCSLEHGEGPFVGLKSRDYRKAMLSL